MEIATAGRRGNYPVRGNKSPLTGQPFLGASANFENVTTFRQDYTALALETSRRKSFEPLPPASVIHKNACYLKMHGSLTQNTYKPPPLLKAKELHLGKGEEKSPKSEDSFKGIPNKMFATNFHLNADRRLDTHCTTNQEGFPPLVPQPALPASHYKDVASGPLGGRVFDPITKSEYSSVFRGDQGLRVTSEDEVVGARLPLLKTAAPRNTLTGTSGGGGGHSRDGGDLLSTHRDTFRGEALSKSATIATSESTRRQRLRTTCIPEGDPSKVAVLQSNHQASYLPPPSQGSDRSVCSRQINQSSIRLTDHTHPPSHYFSTTATNTFQQLQPTERAAPLIRFSRNASFFPRGDLDPSRVRERLNHATTKSAHPQPPAGSFPAHINSCNFHTESSVHLGWSHDWLHPSGTMAASYQPLSQVIQRAKAPSTDNLPLHYYSGHVTNSTAADSYRGLGHGHKINKTNANTMNSLKISHWSLPNMGGPTHITTHRECFTAPRQHVR